VFLVANDPRNLSSDTSLKGSGFSAEQMEHVLYPRPRRLSGFYGLLRNQIYFRRGMTRSLCHCTENCRLNGLCGAFTSSEKDPTAYLCKADRDRISRFFTMKLAASLVTLAISFSGVVAVVPVWGQCGGTGWTGETGQLTSFPSCLHLVFTSFHRMYSRIYLCLPE